MTIGSSRILGIFLLAGWLLGSCGGSSDASPEILSVQLADRGPIFRSLSITLADPGGVEVEYWSTDAPHLVARSTSSNAAAHDVALTRLRAATSYTYEVRTSTGDRIGAVRTTGSFHTAALPAELQSIGFATTGSPTEPLLFLSVRSDFTGGVVIDGQGQVVWYGQTGVTPQGATRRANGNWVLVEDGLTEFSPLGEKVSHLAQSRMPPGATIHHGVAVTPRNTLIFLALDPRTFGSRVLNGESIWEWDPRSDALAKRWSAFDSLDPTTDLSVRSLPGDWFHANSIAMGQHENVIVSFHFLDQILSISPDFSTIEWRLGGPGSTVAITADQATSGQHSAREISPGEVLLFDNGFARADGAQYSRVLQIKIDPGGQTASTIWQYRPDPTIWATVISSVRRIANGNSVVTFGTPAGLVGATGPIAIHEVSPDGVVLWKVIVSLPAGSIFQGDPMRSIGGESLR